MHSLDSELDNLVSQLVAKKNRQCFRTVYVLAGEISWQKKILNRAIENDNERLLLVTDHEDFTHRYSHIATNKVKLLLGSEKELIIFDVNNKLDADALAAVSGTIVGGGVLILLMSAREKWASVYSTAFEQRFVESIISNEAIHIISEKMKVVSRDKIADANITPVIKEQQNFAATKNDSNRYITNDQQIAANTIYKQITEKNNLPVVLISDRGRGKSATLGFVAADLLEEGISNIVITAPSLNTTNIIFKHIQESQPGFVVKRGQAFSEKAKNKKITFHAPDDLIVNNISADVLFVDEAASIPVSVLISLLDKYPLCVFATTVHGYEGTGRGFTVKFFQYLDKYKTGWSKISMQTPIRWPENDPLEKWIFKLFCLDAGIYRLPDTLSLNVNEIIFKKLDRITLSKDNVLLSEIFSLLVLAHYKTRPGDLQTILSSDTIRVYAALYNNHVIAVSMVSEEGCFSKELSNEVYKGSRRLKGHLFAQALTYHCGIKQAAILKYARIMRIAVIPELQNNSIGTQLIDYIIQQEKYMDCDAIGVSYGMNRRLLDFWSGNKFKLVRIGFKREKTSAEHAAIMMHALSKNGCTIEEEAAARFNEKIGLWINSILNDIEDNIKQAYHFVTDSSAELTESEKEDFESYCRSERDFELVISAVHKYVLLNKTVLERKAFNIQHKVILTEKIINNKDWTQVVVMMGLKGKKQAHSVLRDAVLEILKHNKENHSI